MSAVRRVIILQQSDRSQSDSQQQTKTATDLDTCL